MWDRQESILHLQQRRTYKAVTGFHFKISTTKGSQFLLLILVPAATSPGEVVENCCAPNTGVRLRGRMITFAR